MREQKEEPSENKEEKSENKENLDEKQEQKHIVPIEAQKEIWSNEELQRFGRAGQAFTLIQGHLRALNLKSTKVQWASYIQEKGLKEKKTSNNK